jgi:hypothetical protein
MTWISVRAKARPQPDERVVVWLGGLKYPFTPYADLGEFEYGKWTSVAYGEYARGAVTHWARIIPPSRAQEKGRN